MLLPCSQRRCAAVRQKFFLLISLFALPLVAGCLGRFAANQGRRQAARSSDYYLKKYVEPELSELYAGDPDARMEIKRMSREGRNWLAEVVVHSKGGSSRQTVLMDSNGNIISRRE